MCMNDLSDIEGSVLPAPNFLLFVITRGVPKLEREQSGTFQRSPVSQTVWSAGACLPLDFLLIKFQDTLCDNLKFPLCITK